MNVNKSTFYIEKLLVEKIDKTDTSHNIHSFLGKITELSETKEDIDIAINDANSNYISNLFGLKALIGVAEQDIKIYTSHIRDDIYGNAMIRATINNWLKGDSGRKISFLIRERINIDKTKLAAIKKEFDEQIEVRMIKLREAEGCTKSAVIIDNQAIKLKKVEDGIEYVVLNFGATEVAEKLSMLFDIHFLNENNSCTLDESVEDDFDLVKDYIGKMVVDIMDSSHRSIPYSVG